MSWALPVLWVVLGLVTVLFLLGVLLLALPVQVQFLAEYEGRTRMRIRLALLDGHLPGIALVDSWRPPKPKRKAAQKKQDKPPRAGRRHVPPAGAILKLIMDILGRIRIRRLRVQGVVGLGDPADTGQLFGALCPLTYGLPAGIAAIDVVPEFSGPHLEGRAEGVLSVTPLALLPPVLRFGWKVWRRKP
ncbi:DUF2953 domain-containing protein [Antarctobacter sp.]|uniref:DUF2953 domain-containing protein n=1 Tax=Antarctobacter sp. TaxID=1872577 RepID=UPI002B26F541|nr:DUF2953 domain-containing protein [Antarctobacter sp.]